MHLRTLTTILYLPIMISFLFLTDCVTQSPNDQNISPEPYITVSVKLFSGVPDPTYKIKDKKEIATLKEMIQGLPLYSSHPPYYKLGFIGFSLFNKGFPDFPERVDVFTDGTIIILNGSIQTQLKDEKGLLDKMAEKTLALKFNDTHLEKIIHSQISQKMEEK